MSNITAPSPQAASQQAHTHVPEHPTDGASPRVDRSMRFLSRPPSWQSRPAVPARITGPGTPGGSGTATCAPEPGTLPGPAQPGPAQRYQAQRSTAERGPAPRARNEARRDAVEVRQRVEVVLRLVLEVLDRRRRPEHLSRFADRQVVDSVRTLSLGTPPGRELGTAALRRIRITSAGPAVVEAGKVTPRQRPAVEVCASYVRGHRTLAIAGHFERRRDGWRCTALHLA